MINVGIVIHTSFFINFNTLLRLTCRHKLNLNFPNNMSIFRNYHNDIESAVNKQIKYEHQAAIDYLHLAINFLHPNCSSIGVGSYFMKMYKEELYHMEVLIHYQLKRGGRPTLAIEKRADNISKKTLTVAAAFTQALKMESEITKHLQNIVRTAEAVKDYQCVDFITSKFLEEQINSINELSHHITVINRLCDSEHALWLYDRQLLKSCPKSSKIWNKIDNLK